MFESYFRDNWEDCTRGDKHTEISSPCCYLRRDHITLYGYIRALDEGNMKTRLKATRGLDCTLKSFPLNFTVC